MRRKEERERVRRRDKEGGGRMEGGRRWEASGDRRQAGGGRQVGGRRLEEAGCSLEAAAHTLGSHLRWCVRRAGRLPAGRSRGRMRCRCLQ